MPTTRGLTPCLLPTRGPHHQGHHVQPQSRRGTAGGTTPAPEGAVSEQPGVLAAAEGPRRTAPRSCSPARELRPAAAPAASSKTGVQRGPSRGEARPSGRRAQAALYHRTLGNPAGWLPSVPGSVPAHGSGCLGPPGCCPHCRELTAQVAAISVPAPEPQPGAPTPSGSQSTALSGAAPSSTLGQQCQGLMSGPEGGDPHSSRPNSHPTRRPSRSPQTSCSA